MASKPATAVFMDKNVFFSEKRKKMEQNMKCLRRKQKIINLHLNLKNKIKIGYAFKGQCFKTFYCRNLTRCRNVFCA